MEMNNQTAPFETEIKSEGNILIINVRGSYSLSKAKDLFKLAIDTALQENKRNILIDVSHIKGSVSFIDRYDYSSFLAQYKLEHAATKVDKIAVTGHEPIVHKERFGELVAINRGANVKVFTEVEEAFKWIRNN